MVGNELETTMRTKYKYLPNGARIEWTQWLGFLADFEAALAAQGYAPVKKDQANAAPDKQGATLC
jgi:hypothetical protein